MKNRVSYCMLLIAVAAGSEFFFFQAEDGIRDVERSRGLGDVYKRQNWTTGVSNPVCYPRFRASTSDIVW